MEKLNIALLNDSFPPVIDGVANAVMNYAKTVETKYGHAVVGTPKYPGVEDRYPYPVVRYRSINTTKQLGYRTGYPFSASAIQALAKEKPDLIHSHCPFVSTSLARVLRETVDAPIVFTYHTKFDIDIKRAVSLGFLQKTALRYIVKNIESCDEVWVVSEGAGENLKSLGYRGEYFVMENGVDFPKGPAPLKDQEKVIAEYAIPKDRPVFLFVGRMMWYKGVRLILDALSKVKAASLPFYMVFIGDGANLKEMEAYAKKLSLEQDCLFTGAIRDREKLRAFFSCADLFLFPSTYDTNGIVVREAAACGLGSLLIRNSCAAEGIEHQRNGILASENADSIANILTQIIPHREYMKKIGNNALNDIYISWEDAIEKAYLRYFSVLDRYRVAPKKRESVSDDFFFVASEAIDGLNRTKAFTQELKAKGMEFSEELLEKFKSNFPPKR